MKIHPHPSRAVPKELVKTTRMTSPQAVATQPLSVTAEISEEAREKALTSSGKNTVSPAHRAREMMSTYENMGQINFGKMVSAIARGEEFTTPSAPQEASAVAVSQDSVPKAEPTESATQSIPDTSGITSEPEPPLM